MSRRLVDWNVAGSRAFDRLLPGELSEDGNQQFVESFVPERLSPGLRVVDIGGGKNPFLSVDLKNSLGIHVTGLDISSRELERAPAGAYDSVICADITRTTGTSSADLCICQAVLEHVKDVQSALVSIASFLKPGGVAIIFVPSRNAVFARLNLMLPEKVKTYLLFTIFPGSERNQGFPSYYNRCTPAEFRRMAAVAGMEVEEVRHYYMSSYFSFFLPLYVAWRAWVVLFKSVSPEKAAETFSIALRKAG
jgi:2-polyprenyl-6-hydroxyphenyl methylase/3-demethylubiquinone-9 3-methyltransferase